jgi:hypothetical protein
MWEWSVFKCIIVNLCQLVHLLDNIENKKKQLLVLGAHETWSLALRKEHQLQVTKTTVLRKISGLRRDVISR